MSKVMRLGQLLDDLMVAQTVLLMEVKLVHLTAHLLEHL